MTSAASGAHRMAAMSHLFLSELRAKAGAAPVRKSPEKNHPHPPPPQQMDQPGRADPSCFSDDQIAGQIDRELEVLGQSRPDQIDSPVPAGCVVVLSNHLGQDGQQATRDFACHLAGSGSRPVGLVCLDDSGVSLQRLSAGSEDSEQHHTDLPPPNEEQGYSEDQFGNWQLQDPAADAAEQLAILAGQVEQLVICWEYADQRDLHCLISIADSVCLLCGSDQQHLVDCYRQLKQHNQVLADRVVGVFVASAPSVEAGEDIYQRLADASWKFLDLELVDFGAHVTKAAVVEQFVSRHRFSISQGKSVRQANLGLLEAVLAGGRSAVGEKGVVQDQKTQADVADEPSFDGQVPTHSGLVKSDRSFIIDLNGAEGAEQCFDLLLENIEQHISGVSVLRWMILSEWGLKAARLYQGDQYSAVVVWACDGDQWQWALSLPWVMRSAAEGTDETIADMPLVVLADAVVPWAHLAAKAAGFSRLVHWPCMKVQYDGKNLLAVGPLDAFNSIRI